MRPAPAATRDHALAHRDTLRVGRTHGIHAEPDVWGHRMADFAFAVARCRDRLERARAAVAVGKLSGAVGTYSNIDPAIEAEVMAELGLRPADVATQVVLRDGIAEWVSVLALIATVCDAIAIEIRHGQRTEVAELAEPFGAGQKGSSAMPHKRNPVRAERISGLARVVRAQFVPVLEGIALWHERDISHSSTERVALPDAAIATDYLLEQTTALMAGLVVDAARMRANLESSHGLIYTSAVLLELVAAGMSREDAYTLVQGAAMDTWPTARRSGRRCAPRRGRPASSSTRRGWTRYARPERYVARLGAVFDRLAGSAEESAMERLYSGKVRDLYADGDDLIMVASDRISVYDVVLPTPIPDKGEILTQLSLWWFERLADLVPNHVVSATRVPAEWAGRAIRCRRLDMIGVECIARGYLAGLGLASYRAWLGVRGRASGGPDRGLGAARAGVHAHHQGRGRRA